MQNDQDDRPARKRLISPGMLGSMQGMKPTEGDHTMSEHTPTQATPRPWIAGDDGQVRYVRVTVDSYPGVENKPYNALVLPSPANAAYIVQAVNAYPRLVDFVRAVREDARVHALIQEAQALQEELKL